MVTMLALDTVNVFVNISVCRSDHNYSLLITNY